MFKVKVKKSIIIPLLIILTILPGCWDAIEIDDRAFILGMAIDISEDDPDIFEVTLEIANPQSMVPEGGEDEKSFTITFTGKTIIEATRNIFTQTEKVPNYEHIQVLIIGEEAAKMGFDRFFDFLLREVEIRRRTHVLVAKGKGKDVLEKVEPKIAQAKSIYIRSILEQERLTGLIPGEIHLGRVIEHLRGKRDFILAKAEIKEDRAKIEGAAVICQYRLEGWLAPHEVECVKLLEGRLKRALISVELPEDKGNTVAFELMGSDVDIKFNMENNLLKSIDINIEVEGNLAEVKNIEIDTLDIGYIREVEKAVKEEMLKNCKEVTYKAQKELNSDIFDFSEKLMYREPKFWKENREKWREKFPQIPINYSIDVKIRRLGLVR